jgi:hypothetical protein
MDPKFYRETTGRSFCVRRPISVRVSNLKQDGKMGLSREHYGKT